jgi:hypothetical protein
MRLEVRNAFAARGDARPSLLWSSTAYPDTHERPPEKDDLDMLGMRGGC